MSISALIAIPSTSSSSGPLTLAEQIAQALKNLQTSLAGGDLVGANAALTSFAGLLQASANQTGSPVSEQVSAGLQTLGTALSLGNLGAANSAFSTLQGDLKAPSSTAAASSALTVQDVVTLLSALPGYTGTNLDGSSSSTTDIGSNLLASLSASAVAANVAAATQATAQTTAGTGGTPIPAVASASQLNVYG